MQGKIIKGIAGFYYVHTETGSVYECKAKGVFRKDKQKPLVGDNVTLDVLDEEKKLGHIAAILPRKNDLIRPAVANVDQALIIFAVTKPEPNFNLLDRFLILMEQKSLPCIICFNKQDLFSEEEKQELSQIYKKAGHKVLFSSALYEQGIEEIKELLEGKTTTVAGPSGVGKSSIINRLQPEIQMETGEISEKIERGKHTTRHSEIIPVNEHTYLVDTPGFSSLLLFDLEKEELAGFYN
jgi:ribosome biogenesis GTPase